MHLRVYLLLYRECFGCRDCRISTAPAVTTQEWVKGYVQISFLKCGAAWPDNVVWGVFMFFLFEKYENFLPIFSWKSVYHWSNCFSNLLFLFQQMRFTIYMLCGLSQPILIALDNVGNNDACNDDNNKSQFHEHIFSNDVFFLPCIIKNTVSFAYKMCLFHLLL